MSTDSIRHYRKLTASLMLGISLISRMQPLTTTAYQNVTCFKFNDHIFLHQMTENVANNSVVFRSTMGPGMFWQISFASVSPDFKAGTVVGTFLRDLLQFRPPTNGNHTRCEHSGTGSESFCDLVVAAPVDFEDIFDKWGVEIKQSLFMTYRISCKDGSSSFELRYDFFFTINQKDEFPTTFETNTVTLTRQLSELMADSRLYTVVAIDKDIDSVHSRSQFLSRVSLVPPSDLVKYDGTSGVFSVQKNFSSDDVPDSGVLVYTLIHSADNSSLTITINVIPEPEPNHTTSIAPNNDEKAEAGASTNTQVILTSTFITGLLMAVVLMAWMMYRNKKKSKARETVIILVQKQGTRKSSAAKINAQGIPQSPKPPIEAGSIVGDGESGVAYSSVAEESDVDDVSGVHESTSNLASQSQY